MNQDDRKILEVTNEVELYGAHEAKRIKSGDDAQSICFNTDNTMTG